jgi:hypothetical protein
MKIISLRHSKDPKSGVVVYARVQSRSKPRVAHIITGTKRGDGIVWRCSCEHKMFHARQKCDHIIRVEKAA